MNDRKCRPIPTKRGQLQEILRTLREGMPRLEQIYRFESLGIFGPYARGGNGAHSTLNLMVKYSKLPTLIALGKFL